jgi:hypothetical protein
VDGAAGDNGMTYQDPRYRDPEYGTKWRAANPEKVREYSRRHLEKPENREANRRRASTNYYANHEARLERQRVYNTEHRDEIRDKNRERRFGLTADAFLALRTAQGGACAICRAPGLSMLSIDHDHTTGKVRGLLCGTCNFMVGHGKDDPALLRAAADYLEAHDARG